VLVRFGATWLLTTDERTELERHVRSLKIRAEDARRARVILMLANGDSYSTIEATVPCYRNYINRWRRRFLADGLDGLRARYRGQPPTVLTPAASTGEPAGRGSRTRSRQDCGAAAAAIDAASRHSVTPRGPGPVAASASCALQ
jgi:Homeodomain-like domain